MKTKAVITVNYKSRTSEKKEKIIRLRMRTIRTKSNDDENFLRYLTINLQYIPKDPRLKLSEQCIEC